MAEIDPEKEGESTSGGPCASPRRTISEAIALAEEHAKDSGFEPTIDPDFADDLDEIIKNRKPRKLPAWE
jgi:hypothetical protein